jgi:uncharacterized protein (TIGR04255 family)
LAKEIDEIQEELRELTPLIHKVEVKQAVAGSTEEVTSNSWMLLSTDRNLGIVLSSEQLLVFSTRYTRYDDFSDKLARALGALLKHMRFIDVTSMGVRYVDSVQIQPDQTFKDYITPKLLPAEISPFTVEGGATVVVYDLGEIKLQVRCVAQPDQFTMPLDLIHLHAIAQGPTGGLRLEKLGNRKLLLDIDAKQTYVEPSRMNEKDQLLGVLRTLHIKANEFFRHKDVCTDFAFEIWKGGA